MMGWQWHQLNHMQAISTSLQKITTLASHHSDIYGPDALSDTQPTASKHWRLLPFCGFQSADHAVNCLIIQTTVTFYLESEFQQTISTKILISNKQTKNIPAVCRWHKPPSRSAGHCESLPYTSACERRDDGWVPPSDYDFHRICIYNANVLLLT